MSLDPGTRLGPYKILARLGAGGMGEVFRARDTRLGREVAVKVLPPHLAASGDLAARFAREAQILSRLSHPNICTLYDTGHDGDHHYLVMELIDGPTLAERLQLGPVPLPDLLDAALQMTAALEAAHAAGLVHRDLKPGNMMLTGSRIKLLDFGLARPVTPPASASDGDSSAPTVAGPLTRAGAIVGTFEYMSPEQLEGKDADERSDIFSLGCILYEMGTGHRPFAGEDLGSRLGSMLRDRPASLARLNASMPRGLERIVARCLEQDPSARWPNAAAVAAELTRLKNWPRDEGLPELAAVCERILVLEESRDSWTAWELAVEIEKFASDDPMLDRLRPEFALPVTIESDPPGARVRGAWYGDPPGQEVDFGVTPLAGISFPRGLTRITLERAGHRTVHDLLWHLNSALNNATDAATATWRYTLPKPEEIPPEMEPVAAGGFPLYMPGLDHLETEPTDAFLMDRHPVTNREFKRFVDDGGYRREELWPGPFVEGDRTLTRAEAIARFVDTVGRPGPAGWEMGEYPAGDDDHPVSGVSWYEAAAYAAWAGKCLPTIFHWNRVAFPFACALIAPAANLSGRGTVPVGSTRSVNRFGVHDLAGNVREWVSNAVDRPGERFILGGGWNDPGYSFVDAFAQPSFDRSPSNGFRCIRAAAPEPNAERLERVIEIPFRDFRAEEPVSDELFRFFRRQFRYDRSPLDAVTRAEQEIPGARWQTVEIAAAYGGERMQVHLFLPHGRPPFQPVVLFPGSLAIHQRGFTLVEFRRIDYLVKGGRAVIIPIYKSTWERGGDLTSDYPEETAFYRDHVVMWGKDLGRTIDYLETRADLDVTRLAYFGVSWGGAMGAIMPAVEPRFTVNVLYVAGLNFQRALPEADQINYITRVTQPTLMLNGELDFFFPLETSQKPMFDLLGTPPDRKKRLTYPRGHTVPKPELIRESMTWLDRWLGPVEPAGQAGPPPSDR